MTLSPPTIETLTARIAELEAALGKIDALNETLHTMKGLRVWATEENQMIKREIRATIAYALDELEQVA